MSDNLQNRLMAIEEAARRAVPQPDSFTGMSWAVYPGRLAVRWFFRASSFSSELKNGIAEQLREQIDAAGSDLVTGRLRSSRTELLFYAGRHERSGFYLASVWCAKGLQVSPMPEHITDLSNDGWDPPGFAVYDRFQKYTPPPEVCTLDERELEAELDRWSERLPKGCASPG